MNIEQALQIVNRTADLSVESGVFKSTKDVAAVSVALDTINRLYDEYNTLTTANNMAKDVPVVEKKGK